MKKTIYFVRHGQTEYNVLGIAQGSGVNTSLNETGQQQAKALFEAYKNMDFQVVFASALKRTQETVKHFTQVGIPTEYYAEINELGRGICEGKSKDIPEIKAMSRSVKLAWRNGDYDARVEGGESAQELHDRVAAFFEMLKNRAEERILVCTHGRTMSVVCCLLEERPLKDMDLFSHDNTAVTKTVYDGERFIVDIHSDMSHLV